jgi:hypothetical protein
MNSIETLYISFFVGLLLLGIREILSSRADQSIQSEAIRKLKNSILTEVEYNEELLNEDPYENPYGRKMYLFLLFRDAFESAKSTNYFKYLSSETQRTASSYYGGIDRWNELVDKLDSEQISVVIQRIYSEQSALNTSLKNITIELKELLKSEK